MTDTRKGTNPGPGKLTPKQLRFVEEYPKDFNAAAAAIRAGYSKRGAKQTGHHLLTNTDLQAAIQAQLKADSVAAGVERQKLIDLAYRTATFDTRKLCKKGEDGKTVMIDPAEWPDDVAGVMTVTMTARGPVFQTRVSSIDGLEFCMKYAMFEDQDKDGSQEPDYVKEIKDRLKRLAVRIGATS